MGCGLNPESVFYAFFCWIFMLSNYWRFLFFVNSGFYQF